MLDDGEILSFKIDRWSPATIPMARLADYMQLVAELYGEGSSVHFKGLRKGSAIIDALVQSEAMPKVATRLQLVNTQAPPEDVARIFRRIDDLLREDDAVGSIARPGFGKIIEFPGRKIQRPEPISIQQPTTVDGIVVRIGGWDQTIPLMLQDAEGKRYKCTVKGRTVAREIAAYLFGPPIRVNGVGDWTRGMDGLWVLDNLLVTNYEVLEEGSLAEDLAQLRAAAAGGWGEGAMERWKRDRKG